MNYTHLTTEERAFIVLFLEKEEKISNIAKLLGRNKSTISREIKEIKTIKENIMQLERSESTINEEKAVLDTRF